MGVVFPNETIARRWDGALQAKLRRAPLEAFLKRRSLPLAPSGAAQNSDNLIRAAVFIVEAGLSAYCRYHGEILNLRQRVLLGRVACIVSRALAGRILQLESWRIVALVSTARLLSPSIGLNAAALESACATRLFEKQSVRAAPSLDPRLSACAGEALSDDESVSEAAAIIALHLDVAATSDRLLTFG
jgi:hypothetical protein